MAASIAASDLVILDRQIGQVDVHRQARHVAHEQVDRGTAFEGEGFFLRHERNGADEKGDLLPVRVEKGHDARYPARSDGTVMW